MALHASGYEDYGGASRPVLRGGGSVLGTPPSETCSVHSDPDQYRRSCRPEGSVSQPGAIPVKVTAPGDSLTAPDPWVGNVGSVNELAGGEGLCRPRRRRCDDNTRTANSAKKTTRAIEEPWP